MLLLKGPAAIDAYATACMVLGPEEGLTLLKRMENAPRYNIDAFFIQLLQMSMNTTLPWVE